MSVAGRFCLDTNILVYAVDLDAEERNEKCWEIVGQASQSDCVLPIQLLAEFFQVTVRKKLLEPERASSLVCDWSNTFQLASADASTLMDAMDAVKGHRLSFWDAMIWAVARRAGCSAMLSEDMQDGRSLGGVAFINPFAADAEERLEVLFRAG